MNKNLGISKAKLFSPFVEWSVDYPSFSGNPFDVDATVTFTHSQTGETRETGMFYDGDGVWKFRFAGVDDGNWTFATS
ncbi:MAG: DUF5060 domain-containing protein, partial [Pseudomonadota bacterium]